MDFQQKTALITGAAGTLGRATAAAFRQAGARLALVDIAAETLGAAHGPETADLLPIAVNLDDGKSVAAAVEAATRKFGRIDIVCNIVGGFAMGPTVHESPDSLWRSMFEINVDSLLNVVRTIVPAMLAQGHGKIVNVGAMGGVAGRPNMGAYSAAKSAVIRITESMAAELRDGGINVNCVLPSLIDTPPNRADMPNADFSRWVAPAALADVILFLASDKARAIHGAAIPVVGLS